MNNSLGLHGGAALALLTFAALTAAANCSAVNVCLGDITGGRVGTAAILISFIATFEREAIPGVIWLVLIIGKNGVLLGFRINTESICHLGGDGSGWWTSISPRAGSLGLPRSSLGS